MFIFLDSILRNFGRFLKDNQKIINFLQFTIILLYLVLLIVPCFMEIPPYCATLFNNFASFSKFVFWGIWWPFVILSMVLCGRFWCGLFCPEGALAEFSSKKFGLGKTIPRILKWRGWFLLGFACTTIYGQLISVYDYAKPALLILGGSTIAAIIISILYGKRGTRIWCRYLCPVSGVFNLLSRLAPISFKVDDQKWNNYSKNNFNLNCPTDCNPQCTPSCAPNCAPMLNLHQLKGISACHMCGRCADFRDSIELKRRSVNEEIVKYGAFKTTDWDRRLLIFGMLGLAIGAFTWTRNPAFIAYKQAIGMFLIEHDIFWPAQNSAPWWILTNYPKIRDIFNYIDGFCLVTYILFYAIIIGNIINLSLRLICKIAQKKLILNHLAMAFLPLAFASLFLGLSASSVNLLHQSNINLPYVNFLRAVILIYCSFWSLILSNSILNYYKIKTLKKMLALGIFLLPIASILYCWLNMFWLW